MPPLSAPNLHSLPTCPPCTVRGMFCALKNASRKISLLSKGNIFWTASGSTGSEEPCRSKGLPALGLQSWVVAGPELRTAHSVWSLGKTGMVLSSNIWRAPQGGPNSYSPYQAMAAFSWDKHNRRLLKSGKGTSEWKLPLLKKQTKKFFKNQSCAISQFFISVPFFHLATLLI